MDRRNFVKAGCTLAAASSLLPANLVQAAVNLPQRSPLNRSFPKDFLWGSATASYQVEGAATEDGRGASIWDTFSHTPGKVANGDTGDVADDHFHRYKEDIALMKALGVKGYRFSIAWPRVFPQGVGAPNPKGLDFYKRMLDELANAGITPFCTLFHWDLPQALEDKGGWQNRDTSKAFADYCGYTAGALKDRIKNFMTINEMWTFVEMGYGTGQHAPGLKLDKAALAATAHNVVLAHGMAVGSIRATCNASTRVGIADNANVMVPITETNENIRAAASAMREENARYLTVLMEGRYTENYLRNLGTAAPKFTPEEMKTIASPLDFVGLNVYNGNYVEADDSNGGYKKLSMPSSYPAMLSPWLKIVPEGLYWSPRLAHQNWGIKNIYITENGCSSDDQVAADGHIYDTDRVMFLRNYLTHLQRAVSEGIPVKGYFLWSLMDNYEWADGYGKRFGITYVDFKTQKRTPKLSSEFYREVITHNALM
jgi:beta-glucosidase